MNTLMADPSRRVEAVFSGPEPQRRATVLFRLILAIPIMFVSLFVGIVFVIVVVIAWFAALFMGRLPRWAHGFLSDVVPWFTRIEAYLFLLTDRYPPFSFDDTEYAVRPLMPPSGRLNRWAVLFRFVIIVPAAVFLQIVRYGLTIPLLFVTWLTVLFRGQMPMALYGPYAASVRYSLRLSSYECMVTSEYAWGMLGDRPAPRWVRMPPAMPPAATSGVPAAATSAPPPPPPPPPMPPPMPPQYPPPSPGWAGPTGQGVAMPPPTAWERLGPPSGPPGGSAARGASSPTDGEESGGVSLVLTGAARGFMIFAIVWGSVLVVGVDAAQALASRHRNDAAAQYDTVLSDYAATAKSLDAAGKAVPDCQTVACARPYDTAAVSTLNAFGDDLRAMTVSSGASSAQQHVEDDLAQLSSTLNQLAESPDAAAYARTGRRSDLAGLVGTYADDVQSLVNALQQAAASTL
jgi:Domain of unknown function (DUF4389)